MSPNPTTSTTLPLPPSPPQAGSIPVLGLGVCASKSCTSSARSALSQGYAHLDTAQIYRNERETGDAVRSHLSSSPSASRSDIFICSKLWETDLDREQGDSVYTREAALAGAKKSLAALGEGIEYIDLYLLHTPRPGPAARLNAWLGLQDALSQGIVRAIGVSNWNPKHIEALRGASGVTTLPCVNQVEVHPWNQQKELRAWCARQEPPVRVVSYSPLTQGKRLGDETVGRIAAKHGRTAAQVVLRWCLQVGTVVIPKSDNEGRIRENMGCVEGDWELDDEDMKEIEGLDEGDKGRVGDWNPYAWE